MNKNSMNKTPVFALKLAITQFLFLSINGYFCFPEILFMGQEQVFQADSFSFFGRSSPSGFLERGFLKSSAAAFCLCDNLHMDRFLTGKFLEPFQRGNRKKIPVGQENGIPRRLCGQVRILDHLYHMGRVGYRGSFPSEGILQTVMKPDA